MLSGTKASMFGRTISWICARIAAERASRRQHGRDALVVEWPAVFVQEALLGHLGRPGPPAELSAFGPLAGQMLRKGNSIRVRLVQALPALTLPGSHALTQLPQDRRRRSCWTHDPHGTSRRAGKRG